MILNSLEDALKDIKFNNYKSKEQFNLQLFLSKENKTFLNNYNDKELKNNYLNKEKDQSIGFKKENSKKIITKMHNSFGVKNSSTSPSHLVQKSRNNQKSVYNEFVIEKKTFNIDNNKKSRMNTNTNNMTISPQKQFMSVNNEKNDGKNYSFGLGNKAIDITMKNNKNNNNKPSINNTSNNNLKKNHHKVNSDFLNKHKQKYSLREQELFNLSYAVMHTNSDEASSNNTLTQFSNQICPHHKKSDSCNFNKEYKFNFYLKNLFESKLNSYKEKIMQFDFFALYECLISILQNMSKVDSIFATVTEQYFNLIDIEISKTKYKKQIEQINILQKENDRLNRSINDLKELNKQYLIEMDKKDNEILIKDKLYNEEIELYKKREQKILRILNLIESGGISLNQVININNNSNVFSNNNNAVLSSPENSCKMIENNSNPDITVYFPDKTPKIPNKCNYSNKFVPKLNFNNLPKYESPLPTHGEQNINDDCNILETDGINVNKNLILSFNDKFSFEDHNKLNKITNNIESIELSSQSISKINNGPLLEDDLKTSGNHLHKEASFSPSNKNSISPLKTNTKLSNNTQSFKNINEIINNKKYYDLKKLSQSKKLIQSFKTINFSKHKLPIKFKNSGDPVMNNHYINTDN